MTNTHTVSVIVPTYNRRGSLVHSVESILNQTLPVFEVIIVDDGSNDGTGEEVERRTRQNLLWRDRVRYIYQTNKGQSAANNAGISLAQGDWLGFNASDDLWLPTKLEMQFRVFDKLGAEYGVCFSDAWFMNNPHMKASVFESCGGTRTPAFGTFQDPTRLIATGKHPIWVQTAVASAHIVRQLGGFDQSLRYFEDYDFIMRLSLMTKFCFVGMPLVLIDRSPSEESTFGKARDWYQEDFRLRMEQACFEKHIKIAAPFPTDIQRLLRRNLHNVHKAWANWHIERGDYQKAWESVSTATKYGISPTLIAQLAGIKLAPSLLRWAVTRDRKKAVRYDQSQYFSDQSIGAI